MPRPDFRDQHILEYDYDLAAGADLTFAGGVAKENIYRVAVQLSVASSAEGVLRGDLVSPGGAGGSTTQGYFFTLTIPSGTASGTTIVSQQIRRTLQRGDEMVITRTASAGAGVTGHVSVWHEPEYEQLGNNVRVIESTT